MAGRTAARGYGAAHQRARRAWAATVAADRAVCTRCGRPINPDAEWHLDHTDNRAGYLGPAHARCNEAAGGKKAAALRRNRNRTTREVTRLRW